MSSPSPQTPSWQEHRALQLRARLADWALLLPAEDQLLASGAIPGVGEATIEYIIAPMKTIPTAIRVFGYRTPLGGLSCGFGGFGYSEYALLVRRD